MRRRPLNPDTLYLGDNGRATCGAQRCAGATAYASGRDLSGQTMEAVDAKTAAQYGFRCETCGMSPKLVTLA